MIGSDVLSFLAKLPPEAVAGFGRLLKALLAGDPDKAAREARVTAETVAAKQTIRAGYRARKVKL